MAYIDKEKQRQASRKHYLANKDKMKARARTNSKDAKRRNREYVDSYLKSHPCVDCGESDHIVLEFDHIKGEKLYNVSGLKHGSNSIQLIEEEIAKCEVRCANCHRRQTYKRSHNQ